jgi:hypothetical protein
MAVDNPYCQGLPVSIGANLRNGNRQLGGSGRWSVMALVPEVRNVAFRKFEGNVLANTSSNPRKIVYLYFVTRMTKLSNCKTFRNLGIDNT